LEKEKDYTLNEKEKSFHWTEEGEKKVISLLKRDPWQEGDFKSIHRLENASGQRNFLFWTEIMLLETEK
jgi:preprotein translocase subunit SecA